MLGAAFRPSILDRDRAALDPAEFAQPLHEGADPVAVERRRARTQVANGWQFRRLLPSCALHLGRKQQAATEQCDELTPLHVRHGDFLPYALSAPPTGPCARFSGTISLS